jgi:hypothetical protein
MFDHARFRWVFADLVSNAGMPLEWDPYCVPVNELCKRAFAFEGGAFQALPTRRRVLVTALAMLETELVPREGKETLFLTCREYARKHGELESTGSYFEKAENYMKGIGLLNTDNLTGRMIEAGAKLGKIVFEERAENKRQKY